MTQEVREFIINTNKKLLNLPDDATFGVFYHVTATSNVKKILKQGFKGGTWFATSVDDLNVYKRQVKKPYVMVCHIRLDGVIASGKYFTSQVRLIQQNNGIWIPIQ